MVAPESIHEPVLRELVAAARPETRLMLLCADPAPLSDRESKEVERLLMSPLDWEWLIAQGARHALLPLLFRHLKNHSSALVPPVIRERLEADFRRVRIRNLFLIGELRRLLNSFDEAGIRALPIKGALLAVQYPDPALRSFNDLDIIVPRAEVERATAALRRFGYAPQPEFSPAQEAFWFKHKVERLFADGAGIVNIDLHWGLFGESMSRAFKLERIWKELHTTTLPGARQPARTLAPEDALLYLCVHAANSMYERMNWVTDIAVHLRAHPQLDWEQVFGQAIAGGERRALMLGLVFVNELLRVPLPPAVVERLRLDRASRRLVRDMFRSMTEGVSANADPLVSLKLRLLLREEAKDKLRSFVWSFMRPSLADWDAVRLPDKLAWLYPAVRVRRMLKKRLRN